MEGDVVTMQDALARLAAYWAEQGCLTVQPMNTEVGAGTLNPATFLRVLGRREDGYHDIQTLILPLELHDVVAELGAVLGGARIARPVRESSRFMVRIAEISTAIQIAK